MSYRTKKYGWLRDLPDQRDVLYAAPRMVAALPSEVDLRELCPPVYDQGQLGSCTANGIAGAVQFERMKQDETNNFVPSRLFIYYNERVIENTVQSDSGAMIRDGIKSIAKQGDCPETEWPYDITKFADKPSSSCYSDALQYKAVNYLRLPQSIMQMKQCLASGYPVVFGLTVYESFESAAVASSGIVPMPGSQEQVVGGHCMVIVGYDDDDSTFIVRNSWGNGWGLAGYCQMPYAYLLDANLASDFWTIRLVSH